MANSITLTRAFVVIDALDRTGKIFQAVTARTNLFARRMLSIGTRMATLMTVPAYAMKRLTDDFVRFEDKMLEVKAVTGITMAEFKRMSKVAREFGRSVTFSTQEVAEAMAELGRAGFNTNQIEHSMQGVLDLARSAQLTLKEASEFMGSTLQTFRIDMGDSAQVSRMVDIMTATANRSAVTVRDMVETMKMSGTIANTVGLSFEKYAEMIGALGNMGQRGSIAGTSIRRLLTQLATPRVEKEFAKYGVHYYDQYGHIPDPGRAIAEYTQALKDANLGASDIAGKLRSLFGLFGLAGIVAVSKSYENGEFRFKELESSIKNCAGLAHQMAREMDSRLGGAMRLMIASIQECSIAVGEVLAPALSHTAGQVQNLFVWLSKWSSQNASLARGIVGLGAMFFTAGISLTVLGTALYPITGLLGTVGGAFTGLVTTLSTVVPLLQIYLGQVATAFKGGWSYMRISDSNAVKRVVAHDERSKNILALRGQLSAIDDTEAASRARMTLHFYNRLNDNQTARRTMNFFADVDLAKEQANLSSQYNDSLRDITTRRAVFVATVEQDRATALKVIDGQLDGKIRNINIRTADRIKDIKNNQNLYLQNLDQQRKIAAGIKEGNYNSRLGELEADTTKRKTNIQSRFGELYRELSETQKIEQDAVHRQFSDRKKQLRSQFPHRYAGITLQPKAQQTLKYVYDQLDKIQNNEPIDKAFASVFSRISKNLVNYDGSDFKAAFAEKFGDSWSRGRKKFSENRFPLYNLDESSEKALQRIWQRTNIQAIGTELRLEDAGLQFQNYYKSAGVHPSNLRKLNHPDFADMLRFEDQLYSRLFSDLKNDVLYRGFAAMGVGENQSVASYRELMAKMMIEEGLIGNKGKKPIDEHPKLLKMVNKALKQGISSEDFRKTPGYIEQRSQLVDDIYSRLSETQFKKADRLFHSILRNSNKQLDKLASQVFNVIYQNDERALKLTERLNSLLAKNRQKKNVALAAIEDKNKVRSEDLSRQEQRLLSNEEIRYGNKKTKLRLQFNKQIKKLNKRDISLRRKSQSKTKKSLNRVQKIKQNEYAKALRWNARRRKTENNKFNTKKKRGLKVFVRERSSLHKKYNTNLSQLNKEYEKLSTAIRKEYDQAEKRILRDQKRADAAETRGRTAERREARTRYTQREADIARNAKQQLQANAVWSSGRPTGKAGYFGRIWRELDSAITAGSRGQSDTALHFMKRAKQQATLPFRKLFHSMKMANITYFKSLEKEALNQLVNGMHHVMRQANRQGAGYVDSDFDKMREMILSGQITDEVKQLEEYKFYSKPLQQVQKAQEAYTKTNAKSVSALKILRDSLARMPKNFSALWDSMKNGRIFIRMLANGIRGMGNVFKFVWGTIRSSWLSIIEIIVRVVYYGNLWKEALGALLVIMTAVGAGFWAFITAFDMMMRVVGKTVAWLIHAVNRLTSLVGLDFLGAFRGIADAVIGPVVRAFRNIANTVADTFHGVWKRIQIGDWKGAMEYAWTGIQIIWNELKIMFIDISANIRGFIENTDNLLVHLVKFFYQIGAGILDWVDGVGQTPETIQAQAKANYLNMSQEDRSKLEKEGVYNEKDYADYLYFKNARDLGLLFDRTTLVGQNKEYSDIARIQPNQGNAADIQTRKNEWGNNVSFRDIVVTPEGGFYFGDRLGETTRSRREVDSVVLDKTTESYYTSEEETKRKNAQRSIEEARRKQESMDADLKAREEWTNGGRDRALEGFSRWIPDEDRKAEFQRLLGDFFRVKNINTAEAAQTAYDQIAGVGEVSYSDVISNMLRALPRETANKEIASLKSTISSLLDSWQKGDKAGLTKTGEFWDAHSLAEEGWETLELPALMEVIPGLKEAVVNWQETAHEKGLGEAGSLDNVLRNFFLDQKKRWLEQDETYRDSRRGEIDRLTLNALGSIVRDMRKPEKKDYYTRQLEANQKRLDELDKKIKTVGYREMDMVRAGSIEAERQKLEILSNQERQALYREQEKIREENKRLEKERQQYMKSLDVTVKEINHKMPPLSQEAEERVVEIVENGGM